MFQGWGVGQGYAETVPLHLGEKRTGGGTDSRAQPGCWVCRAWRIFSLYTLGSKSVYYIRDDVVQHLLRNGD